MIVVWRGLYKV